MKFTEMCEEILNGNHRMAIRKSYPTLTTTVRVNPNPTAGDILYYYEANEPQIPFVLTKELFESDDWEVFDDYTERFNIQEFMRMPHAKEFLRELYDSINSTDWNGRFTKAFTDKEGYANRFQEAVQLNILYPNRKKGTLTFTDIGYDIMKTL